MSQTCPQNNIILAENGQPLFCVQVDPPMDGEYLLPAADELRTWSGRCLATPPRWYHDADASAVRVVITHSPTADISTQQFIIEADESAIRLVASNEQSLLHAVYYFLEQAFGVRWLWPGTSGEVTPSVESASWPVGRQVHGPSFLWRRQGTGGSFWREMDVDLALRARMSIGPEIVRQQKQWHARMRMGGLHIADGHRWAQICPPQKYGEDHPEYFALYNGERDCVYHNGKHRNQPCTTNPDVVTLVAEYILAQFENRPELDGFSLALNDGTGFCECQTCQEVDRWAGEVASHGQSEFDQTVMEWAPGGSGGVITDRIMKFANDVAERVTQKYPDKLLLVHVYSVFRNPPKRVNLHPNIITQFASMSFSWAAEDIAEVERTHLLRLTEHSEHVGFYDYLVNGANGSMPRGYARTLHGVLREFHEIGGRYYATQPGMDFATAAMGYYVLGRTLWDVTTEFEDIVDDFCRSGFGPAADIMKQYFLAYCDRWEETGGCHRFDNTPRMEQQVLALYPPAWRRARRDELKQAVTVCRDNAECLQRVRFVQKGMQFLDKLTWACQPVVKLCDKIPGAWPFDAPVVREHLAGNPQHNKQLIEATRRRDAFIAWADKHRDQFVYAVLWFEYQRQYRGGLLGTWLDNIAGVLSENRSIQGA